MSLGHIELTLKVSEDFVGYHKISWHIVCHSECCHLVNSGWYKIAKTQRNLVRNICNFAVGTVAADGPSSARTSISTVMTKFRSCLYTGPTLKSKGLSVNFCELFQYKYPDAIRTWIRIHIIKVRQPRKSYLYNENCYTWKDDLYIDMGPDFTMPRHSYEQFTLVTAPSMIWLDYTMTQFVTGCLSIRYVMILLFRIHLLCRALSVLLCNVAALKLGYEVNQPNHSVRNNEKY